MQANCAREAWSTTVAVVPDSRTGSRPPHRRRTAIGVPWLLVALHALALIASGMAGLALALLGF
jgi:hypothetical protein